MQTARALGIALALATLSCGPSGDDETADAHPAGWADAHLIDVFQGPTGAITGTVYMPGNGPGQVPSGEEVPVSGALVWVSPYPPDDIPQAVYCEQCVDTGGTTVFTDKDGVFFLGNVVPNQYFLTIQKGQFRITQQVDVFANQTVTLTSTETTLPSVHDPANGKWIPRIAIAEGYWDKMEDIFGKMGLGSVDGTGTFVGGSQGTKFDWYDNNGYGAQYAVIPLNTLIADLELMKQYHIIFIPCSNGDNSELFANAAYRENIREYVNLGGKFYVTDWSAEWEDAVFPEFIEFAADHDTTKAMAEAGDFNNGDGPGTPTTSLHAWASDPDLNAWIDAQVGPAAEDEFSTVTPGQTINANDFTVIFGYDLIENLPIIDLGPDEAHPEGHLEEARVWVRGDWEDDGNTQHPLTVTFEPKGCGRVLYSTYHTSEDAHAGLLPQERVLMYLIMEIGLCSDNPVVE
jgi:hypothetical protein